MRNFIDVIQDAGALHSAGRLDEAAFLYENLLGAVPNDPVVLYLYGTLHSQQKRFGSAITMLEKATRLEPTTIPEAWHNLGVAYRNEGHIQEARRAYRSALKQKPNDADLLAMLAGSYVNTGSPDQAEKYSRAALKANPTNPHALNHLALALLEKGRYEEAWPAYEHRFELNTMNAASRPFTCPKWTGDKVGKLAIHGEQGVGDEVMMMSCFPDARSMADQIVIECEPRLVKWFEYNFNCPVYGTYDELAKEHPDCDAYIAMGSLPSLFRKSADDFPRMPYMTADPNRVENWKGLLGPGKKIGVAWHGGTKATHQDVRNAPNAAWKQIIDTFDCEFVSVQYGEEAPVQSGEMGIRHFSEAFDDFDEFAAFLTSLDGVVTVCQSVVHFCGALGVPCLVMVPTSPAWRYKLHGEIMDWYGDHVELIRANSTGFDFIKLEKRIADHWGISRAKQTTSLESGLRNVG